MSTRTVRALCLACAGLLLVSCSTTDPPTPGAVPTSTAAASPDPQADPGRITAAPTTREWTQAPTRTEPYAPSPAPTGDPGAWPRGLVDLDPEAVDVLDVDEVSEAFVRTFLSTDTSIDVTVVDAQRRAARWAHPDFAAVLTQDRPGGSGADWIELARTDGYMLVELSDHPAVTDGLITAPAEGDINAERPYVITITPQNSELPARETVGIAYLTRTGPQEPWQVWDYYHEGMVEDHEH